MTFEDVGGAALLTVYIGTGVRGEAVADMLGGMEQE
jgi:hypothetical protein